MRFPLFLAVLTLISASCAVDKGPSACVEGLIAACDCPGGAVSRQVCVDGAFQACECGLIAGSGGTGGSAGTGGVAGFAGTGGSGGVAGSAGTGGVAGFAGTGGSGGVAGFAGTGGSGGVAGSAGSGGVAGFAGTGGTGGVAGSAGTGGFAGTAGTGGTGGDAGAAGEGGNDGSGAVWSRCDVAVNGCDDGLVCYRSTLVSSGPGVCTNECSDSSMCEQVAGASVTATCGSEGVCRFTCAAFGTGTDCPLGMTCSAIEPFVYRCVYKD